MELTDLAVVFCEALKISPKTLAGRQRLLARLRNG
jgi:hypothetical protein